MRLTTRSAAPLMLGVALLSLTACASGPGHHSTSIVGYLYPNRGERVETPAIPVLRLPVRVGVAFIPDDHGACAECWKEHGPISEPERMKLMKEVASHFRDPKLVKAIEIIPTAYLSPRGSFANLDQLRSMFGVDVIALISYDQIQFTDEGRKSLTYWTLVGAYLVQGEKNDTRTLMDVVVYDIPSRKLLFRAPGLSNIRGTSTPVNLSEELRRDSDKGFALASADLITNLDQQLTEFKTRVKEQPEDYTVVTPAGSGGGSGSGGIEGWLAAVMVSLVAVGRIASNRRHA